MRDLTEKEARLFRKGTCPFCGQREFGWVEGPAGGISVNVMCPNCGTKINANHIFTPELISLGPGVVKTVESGKIDLDKKSDTSSEIDTDNDWVMNIRWYHLMPWHNIIFIISCMIAGAILAVVINWIAT